MRRNPEKVSDVLALVQKHLDLGQPREAVELIRKCGSSSPELTNAYGVALMRSGDTAKALEVYRRLCVNENGICLKQTLPAEFKANYATALLLARNVSGCLAVLREIRLDHDPYVQKLCAAIDRWRRSLGWWKRLAFDWYGAEPNVPVSIDFAPGAFVATHGLRPAA